MNAGTNEQGPVPLSHSRACGIRPHPHGSLCHENCPSCRGKPLPNPADALPAPTSNTMPDPDAMATPSPRQKWLQDYALWKQNQKANGSNSISPFYLLTLAQDLIRAAEILEHRRRREERESVPPTDEQRLHVGVELALELKAQVNLREQLNLMKHNQYFEYEDHYWAMMVMSDRKMEELRKQIAQLATDMASSLDTDD